MAKDLLRKAHWVLLVIIAIFISLKATLEFRPWGDYIWYHLPQALKVAGWNDFIPSPYIQMVLETFPTLGETFQGLLVFVFRTPIVSQIANFVALLLVCGGLYTMYRSEMSESRWRWFFTSAFSIPLVVIHSWYGYVDLFGASGVLLALATLPNIWRGKELKWSGICLVLGTGVATMSRFQTWPIIGIILITAMVIAVIKRSEGLKVRAFIILAAVLMSIVWPSRNLVKYGNPTYPYRAPVIGNLFPYKITTDELHPNQIPETMRKWPQWQVFSASVFELTRFQNPEAKFRWSVDQGYNEGIKNPHFRLGGWSVYSMTILTLFFIWGLVTRKIPWQLYVPLCLGALFISQLPQSHELRYFMWLPLGVAWCICYNLDKLSVRSQWIFKILIFASLIHTIEKTKCHKIEVVSVADRAQKFSTVWQEFRVRPDKENLRICTPALYDSLLSTGPTLSEYPVINKDCGSQKFLVGNPRLKEL